VRKKCAVYIEGLEVDGAADVVEFYWDNEFGLCLLAE
jgi:hypothetical protein